MKILYLVSSHAHAHDYGLDFIYDGLRELHGEDVVDWPEKPCLHLGVGQQRDECQIDSDQWWPSRDERLGGEHDIRDLGRDAELVILAHSLEDPDANARVNRVLRENVLATTPVLALDMGDQVRDRRPEYEQVAARSVIYAKRELPIGADWGIPCPMTYPASRVPSPMPAKFPRVVYHATHHGTEAPSVPRLAIVDALRRHPRIPRTSLDVMLYPSQRDRPTPEEYHAKMASGLVGISWNGAENWDANRHWESFAFGLCLIAERPRIQIPNPYQHLRHVFYVDHPEQVADVAATLLNAPGWALSIAAAGHQHFMQHHCSRARAAYLLEQVARVA